MDFDWSEWGPPLGVLIMGLGFGGLFAARARRTANEAATVEEKGRRTDLEERKRSVVEALRALELEKDKMAPEDYARERANLLASGADALRGLDQPQGAPAASASTAGRPRTAADLPEAARKLSLETLAALEKDRERLGEAALAEAVGAWVGETRAAPSAEPPALAPEWKGALYALCVVGLIGVLWVTLGQQATDRGEGGSITGNAQSDGPTAEEQAQHDAEKKELEARVEKDPKDLEALNKLTVIALSDQDVQGAMQRNEAALAVDAKDPEARVYRAVLAGMMGMTDRSLQMLDDVLTDQPDFPMALVYKGLIAIEAGKPDVAIPALEKAIQVGAANPEFLQQELAKAKQMQAGGPMAGGPIAGGPMAGPAAGGPMDGGGGPTEPVVSGTITLDPAAQPRAGSAQVLFVSVKDPAGGPPLAAKKLPPGPFPMDFTITTADELPMAGGRPFPDKVNVSVRLDDDGNAFTHGEGEPQWTTEGVSKGASGLAAVLQ